MVPYELTALLVAESTNRESSFHQVHIAFSQSAWLLLAGALSSGILQNKAFRNTKLLLVLDNGGSRAQPAHIWPEEEFRLSNLALNRSKLWVPYLVKYIPLC